MSSFHVQTEWWVVREWAWMNSTGSGVDRCEIGTYPSLERAKRAGVRHFGHDDFTIAEVRGVRLVRYTWMGEDRGDTPEDLADIAVSLGLTYTDKELP